jgi:DNA repair protein RecN (Recombination protein N)
MVDNHLLTEKQIAGDRTETHVMQLDMDGRVAEIARIMGGDDPSDLMLDNARAEIKKACGL